MSDTQARPTGGDSAGPGLAKTTTGPADSVDISGREDVHKLKKHAVGLPGVLFLTVTGAAPISAMLFNTPIVVGFGEGVGAPAAFLFATVVLTIFSVGYVAMARVKTTAGGFYSYISYGLGREVGIGAGYGSVLAYSVFEASLAGGFAFFLNAKLAEFGFNIGWPWLALLHGAADLDPDLLRRQAVDGRARRRPDHRSRHAARLRRLHVRPRSPPGGRDQPGERFQGAGGERHRKQRDRRRGVGLGLFYAFWSWVGFEMAPNYGEESRDPKRNVPRSLYISVIGLGIFYILTSWAPFAGYSTVNAAAHQAQKDPLQYYFLPANSVAGHWVGSILSYLIITGSFACGMAFHNTTARYGYSMGREGLLPRALGRTHPRYKSPFVASIAQTVVAALIVIGFGSSPGPTTPPARPTIRSTA